MNKKSLFPKFLTTLLTTTLTFMPLKQANASEGFSLSYSLKKNYRSVEGTINMDRNNHILIGINEETKSNYYPLKDLGFDGDDISRILNSDESAEVNGKRANLRLGYGHQFNSGFGLSGGLDFNHINVEHNSRFRNSNETVSYFTGTSPFLRTSYVHPFLKMNDGRPVGLEVNLSIGKEYGAMLGIGFQF